MGFSNENGYVPTSISDMMLSVMANVNTQFGTTYTAETFVGTNFYKYFYALMQRLQENEVKTSEIFLKLQQYFAITNEQIASPVVTNPGLVDILKFNGYVASVKMPIDADAGKVFVCVDTDNGAAGYAAVKLAINTLIKSSTAAGVVTQGSEVSTLALSNGQNFDFKFNLPNRIPVVLRLTTTLSENNQVLVGNPDDVKLKLVQNIVARYQVGKDFEPQRYFAVSDAPWASNVLLEWSTDAGANYFNTVFDANYDDLYSFTLADVSLVEN